MTGFEGDWLEVAEHLWSILGRGFDGFALSMFPERHLPAEVKAGLHRDSADDLVRALSEAGIDAAIVRTDELSEVRHHASELWATRCAKGVWFTEIDGMVLTLPALNARECVAREHDRSPGNASWEVERVVNHWHPGSGEPLLDQLDREVRIAAELSDALREAYPDSAFTLSNMLGHHIMSFWQTAAGSPREQFIPITPNSPNRNPSCWHCGKPREFTPDPHIDPRFPPVEWGRCKECGELIIVKPFEVLTFIGPDR